MREDLVINRIFAKVADRFPDRVCLQIKRGPAWERWTYKEIQALSLKIGAFLVEEGFKKGDSAGLCMENRPEWAAIYLGIMAAGAACVPLDTQLTGQEIENLISDCGAKILFVSNTIFLAKNIYKIKAPLKKIVILDLDIEKENLTSLERIKSAPCEGVTWPDVFPEDIASLIYTSGTTGSPKGVMLTHKNLCSNFLSIDKLKLITDKDSLISILPLHHSYPFMVTLITPLFCRALVTYTSSLRSDELLKTMDEAGVTILVGVPQLFYIFYTNISERMKKIPCSARIPLLGLIEILWQIRRFSGINLSKLVLRKIHRPFGRKLRFFVAGGAKLNEEAASFLVKTGFTILEGYGLTETSPVVTFNPLERQKIGSVGKIIPDVELKIADPDKEGIGEVVIKGPNVMKGYYKRDEETAGILKDDWFYSGDVGYMDKDGYLYLTGRKKEMIVLSSGKKIFPEEIESHYARSPYIKEICVLGVGEEEALTAVVVPDLDYCRQVGEVNLRGKIRWEIENLSDGLSSYKRIKGFILVKEGLPRTRLGKIKRFEVANKYLNEIIGIKLEGPKAGAPSAAEDLKLLSSDVGKKTIEALNKKIKLERELRLDDHLELDLGVDSLGRVELMIALEQALDVSIPDELMTKILTVKELITEMERLALSLAVQGKPVPQAEAEALWGGILRERPAEEAARKLCISPTPIAILGTLALSGILRAIFRIIWELKIRGAKNIPQDRACILCVNHGSFLDAFIVGGAVPSSLLKNLFFIGFRGFFVFPVIRDIIKFIRVIPIDPGTHLVEAMQASYYVLRNGKIACVFPEGERSIDGEVKVFKKGIGILAKESGVPLVPVYISGSYESWPRTKPLPRPHPIKIIFGRPFDFEELKKEGLRLGAKDDYEAIALGIREEVIKLKGEE